MRALATDDERHHHDRILVDRESTGPLDPPGWRERRTYRTCQTCRM
jgi:hypothetical protein